MIPRLPSFREKSLVSIRTKYFRKFYYKQTLDHFNYLPESFKTFNQRYFINFKYWGGANSSTPIFVTFGGEAALEENDQEYVGFIEENAASFKALLVYIEVRFCRTIIFLYSWA
jgi:lysosomal Pro-X carboxypeptidase